MKNILSKASILAAAFVLMAAILGGDGRLSQKPVVMTVEPLSRLRSETIKPERAKPVTDNGKIYAVSSRNVLATFDFNGEKIASLKLGFGPSSTPAILNNRLYVGGDDGKFHCLDLATGLDVWSHELMVIDMSEPTLAGGMVLFMTGRDLVLALDAETGAWAWEYQHLRAVDLAVRGLGKPVVDEGTVFIGLTEGAVASFDLANGKLLWKSRVFTAEQFTDVDAPVVVDDSYVFAVSVAGRMAALSRKTGKVLWRHEAGGMGGLVVDGDRLYLADQGAKIVALDKITSKVLWETRLIDGDKSASYPEFPLTPITVSDLAVAVTRDGRVVVLNKDTGEIAGDFRYRAHTMGGPVPVRNGFMVMDNKGIIRMWPNL